MREKKIRIYETCKYTIMPHGHNIYSKAYDMEKATVCLSPQSDHALPHWKYVMQCCDKCPIVNLPDQETDD